MKKLLLILLCLPLIGFGQITLIPDANFEQRLISFGYDNILDGTVLTAAIDTVTHLEISYYVISDLTGIEDFTDLTELFCSHNGLTSLDVSQNTALSFLNLTGNQLTSLDVSQNTFLTQLWCDDNQLTSIDVSQNTSLTFLRCDWNQLTSLDVSTNTALTELSCYFNQLTSLDVSNNTTLNTLYCSNNNLATLDVRNGNNTNFSVINPSFNAKNNPNLYCIDVDNVAWSTANWIYIDSWTSFGTNCSATSVQEHTTNKELLKVTDLLGRETKGKKNRPLFYIYDDGTVEKRITIE